MTHGSRVRRIETSLGDLADACETCGHPERSVRIFMDNRPEGSGLSECPPYGRPVTPCGPPLNDAKIIRVCLGQRQFTREAVRAIS